MTSAVAISFNNCTFNANQSTIVIGNGTIDLAGANQIAMVGTFTFSALNVLNTQIQFDNNTGTGTVYGTISIPISPNGTATITVNAFTGQASAAWPNGGFSMVAPGELVTLNGLT
jgi:hypothetical protein